MASESQCLYGHPKAQGCARIILVSSRRVPFCCCSSLRFCFCKQAACMKLSAMVVCSQSFFPPIWDLIVYKHVSNVGEGSGWDERLFIHL
jgi:hypothetical protein